MASKILRIGFDFDGVIAYNPLRTLRLPFMVLRSLLIQEKTPRLHFLYPQNKASRWLWSLAHETSFFPAYGFSDLKHLLETGKIKGYIITGRYSFLETSLWRWLARHGVQNLFNGIYINKTDEQPHLFKERMLKDLKLDMFVEDNWDIVQHLNQKIRKSDSTQIHWIYNLLDRFKPYPNKHPYLKEYLQTLTENKKR